MQLEDYRLGKREYDPFFWFVFSGLEDNLL